MDVGSAVKVFCNSFTRVHSGVVKLPSLKLSLNSVAPAATAGALMCAYSVGASATAVTPIATMSTSLAVPSLVVTLSVDEPLKSLAGLKLAPSSAALMAAAVPVICSVPVSLPVKVTPAVDPSVSVPCVTTRVVVNDAESTSDTVMALPLALENTHAVSSLVACVGGSEFTGASLVPVTVISRFRVEVAPWSSVTVNGTVSSRDWPAPSD